MGYVDPPEPADHIVIVEATEDQPAFTWGEHRSMKKMLDEMEDPNHPSFSATVKASSELLDNLLESYRKVTEQVCEFCWKKVSEEHEIDCPDHNDPAMWVKREAGGYQYLDDKFVPVHLTSVPMTDEEALDYFKIVSLMFPTYPNLWVRYITRREINGTEFKMMPYQFNKDLWQVFPL